MHLCFLRSPYPFVSFCCSNSSSLLTLKLFPWLLSPRRGFCVPISGESQCMPFSSIQFSRQPLTSELLQDPAESSNQPQAHHKKPHETGRTSVEVVRVFFFLSFIYTSASFYGPLLTSELPQEPTEGSNQPQARHKDPHGMGWTSTQAVHTPLSYFAFRAVIDL